MRRELTFCELAGTLQLGALDQQPGYSAIVLLAHGAHAEGEEEAVDQRLGQPAERPAVVLGGAAARAGVQRQAELAVVLRGAVAVAA